MTLRELKDSDIEEYTGLLGALIDAGVIDEDFSEDDPALDIDVDDLSDVDTEDVNGDGDTDVMTADTDGDGETDTAVSTTDSKDEEKAADEKVAESMPDIETPEEFLIKNEDATPTEYSAAVAKYHKDIGDEAEHDASAINSIISALKDLW